jgi:type IV pilus assembly protein PilC
MIQFKYTAKDQTGDTRIGIIEAVDQRQASTLLHDMGLVVIKIVPKGDSFDLGSILRKFRGTSTASLSNFTRQLATMINAGLSLIDAMVILEKQLNDVTIKQALREITKDVQSGSTFASALAKHSHIFPSSYISMIKSGEASGTLDQVLNRLADTLEKQREFESKVKGAFIYPIIIVIAMMLVSVIVLVFVVPRISSLYTDLNVDLPLPTKVLLFLSDTVRTFWWALIFIPPVGFYGLKWFRKTPEGRIVLDGLTLKIPVIGRMNEYTSFTQLTRTLGSLIGSGVPILDALKISSEVAGNAVHQHAIKDSAKMVEKGGQLSAAFSHQEVFPPIIPQMIAVGEETGKLDEVMDKLSHYFEVEVEQQVKNLTSALEPLIMIFLGIGVALLVISIILPIYKITSSL